MINENHIFWDWNGTLLNDTDICLWAMNTMIAKRNMEHIDIELYKEIFGFPVIEYYKNIGFDFKKESFEDLSYEFISLYNSRASLAQLMPQTHEILEYFRKLKKKNYILSAMQHDMLVDLVDKKGINQYFTDIIGIENIYAHSKSSIGLEYVKYNAIPVNEIILIGDTLHDYEVAEEIGCQCILIANGHQSEERLKATGAKVVKSLSDLFTIG